MASRVFLAPELVTNRGGNCPSVDGARTHDAVGWDRAIFRFGKALHVEEVVRVHRQLHPFHQAIGHKAVDLREAGQLQLIAVLGIAARRSDDIRADGEGAIVILRRQLIDELGLAAGTIAHDGRVQHIAGDLRVGPGAAAGQAERTDAIAALQLDAICAVVAVEEGLRGRLKFCSSVLA